MANPDEHRRALAIPGKRPSPGHPGHPGEVERSLLAISELEAHMLSIRDELLKLCKQGACRSFPDAELANSPRTNSWIVSWRQSPANERTLGHSLVVIKLCQLHLSRLVQRLAEIYAWFAETSNADLSWKKLKAWQRIWTLQKTRRLPRTHTPAHPPGPVL
ncbi:MAG: hypothetical protein ACI4VB_04625 [Bradymonadia bacterium]